MPRVLFVLSICLLASSVAVHRSKCALWDFNTMIQCTVPESIPALDYADYGCYCGKGGSGTPVDDLDRCCEVHDRCYGDASQHPSCWPIVDNPYTKQYDFKCVNATKTVTCPRNSNSPCQKFICDCDRKAAICFASADFNEEYVHLPRDRCT